MKTALIIAFALFCPLIAHAEAEPVKWEYIYFYAGENGGKPKFSAIMRRINELGEQGWELIRAPAMDGVLNTGINIFKRPKLSN